MGYVKFDKEELELATAMVKAAGIPVKALKFVKAMTWHDMETVELSWYAGLHTVSISSYGIPTNVPTCMACTDGWDWDREKEITPATTRKIVKAIMDGTDRGIVKGMIVRAKSPR